jgi:hypothetical protein
MVAEGGQRQLRTQGHRHQQPQQTKKLRQDPQRGIDSGNQAQVNESD